MKIYLFISIDIIILFNNFIYKYVFININNYLNNYF